jgi:hypothetical protein
MSYENMVQMILFPLYYFTKNNRFILVRQITAFLSITLLLPWVVFSFCFMGIVSIVMGLVK